MMKKKPLTCFLFIAALTLLLPALAGAYPAEVPRTGQTTCYDSSGLVIPCAGTGQDGAIQAGAVWPNPRFIDNGNTVSDKLTGLEWTKDVSIGGQKTWQEALDFVKTLNTGGHNDWRLPNRRELRSLVDYAQYNPALPQSNPFTKVQSGKFWSSTSIAASPVGAWVVGMEGGDDSASYNGKTDNFYVWPVRSGQMGH